MVAVILVGFFMLCSSSCTVPHLPHSTQRPVHFGAWAPQFVQLYILVVFVMFVYLHSKDQSRALRKDQSRALRYFNFMLCNVSVNPSTK